MIQIRPGTPEDAVAASRLAWRAKSSWDYPAEWLDEWRTALTITSEYLRTNRSLVAIEDGKVVGVCVLQVSGRRASLEHVWIAPEHQKQGIGRMLVTRALEMASHAGVARVEVEADPFAEAFYARLGARRVGATSAPMPGAPGRTLPRLEFIVDGAGPVATGS